MSVAAFINDPINEEEDNLYIPIASENFFVSYWKPACQALDLKWIPLFNIGIDITKENLPEIISELTKLQDWAKQNLSDEKSEHIRERIELLIRQFPSIFKRDDVSLFIG